MANLNHLGRVLVVEDEAIIALDIESTLSDLGVAIVDVTGTYAEAERMIAEQSFDAAVLDMHLGPNDWSYGLARALQAKGVPFIFSSGTVDVAEGFTGVPLVMKPFSTDQLIAALLQVTVSAPAIAAQ